MSIASLHAMGYCSDSCRYCDYAIAHMQEDHSKGTCGGFATCSICREAHNCDTQYEYFCPECNRGRRE